MYFTSSSSDSLSSYNSSFFLCFLSGAGVGILSSFPVDGDNPKTINKKDDITVIEINGINTITHETIPKPNPKPKPKLNLNSKRLEETSDKKMSYYAIELDAGPFFLVISFF